MDTHNFWVGVVSRAHIYQGVKDGFLQLNHGKKAPVQRMNQGDGIVIYSPRAEYPAGEALQKFTAIGTVATGEIYQVEMSPDFKPYRLDVNYSQCQQAAIKPLIETLSFIKNKERWGATFRFGLIQIEEPDFLILAEAMGCAQEFGETEL